MHGAFRGFIDDTSWGASNHILGVHQNNNWSATLGYGIGTTGSMALGLVTGGLEAKIAAKTLGFSGRTLAKAGKSLGLLGKDVKRAAQTESTVSKVIKQIPTSKNTVQNIPKGSTLGQLPKGGVPKFDLNALSRAGEVMDRGGLTRAGRSLDKHGNRPGSIFFKATGNPASKNRQGQFHLDDILTHPQGTVHFGHHKQFGQILDIKTPSTGGARFYRDGKMIGFLEP